MMWNSAATDWTMLFPYCVSSAGKSLENDDSELEDNKHIVIIGGEDLKECILMI